MNKIVFIMTVASMLSASAFADTKQANMEVSLTVLKACRLSTNDLNFGSHMSSEGALEETSTASVVCTKKTPYQLSATSANSFNMKQKNGSDEVAYTLSATTSAGKQTLSTANTFASGVGTGDVEEVRMTGNVTSGALQAASAGTYTDTVVLSVSY